MPKAELHIHLDSAFEVDDKEISQNGPAGSMFSTVSPTGPRQSRTFTIMGRNYELDVDQDRKFLEFNDLVIGQDRPIIESQRPEELPVDLSSEIQIRGADRGAVEYRRWLRELAYSNS